MEASPATSAPPGAGASLALRLARPVLRVPLSKPVAPRAKPVQEELQAGEKQANARRAKTVPGAQKAAANASNANVACTPCCQTSLANLVWKVSAAAKAVRPNARIAPLGGFAAQA
mmetsp:Transcript_28994/g.62999  ORF Transcript_28994/g.62999 Transcript_28994/m.62999 type:complete len:116 (-) Transcript_28994:12-359(-)